MGASRQPSSGGSRSQCRRLGSGSFCLFLCSAIAVSTFGEHEWVRQDICQAAALRCTDKCFRIWTADLPCQHLQKLCLRSDSLGKHVCLQTGPWKAQELPGKKASCNQCALLGSSNFCLFICSAIAVSTFKQHFWGPHSPIHHAIVQHVAALSGLAYDLRMHGKCHSQDAPIIGHKLHSNPTAVLWKLSPAPSAMPQR